MRALCRVCPSPKTRANWFLFFALYCSDQIFRILCEKQKLSSSKAVTIAHFVLNLRLLHNSNSPIKSVQIPEFMFLASLFLEKTVLEIEYFRWKITSYVYILMSCFNCYNIVRFPFLKFLANKHRVPYRPSWVLTPPVVLLF